MEDPTPDAAGLGSRDVPVAGLAAGGTTLHLGTRSDAC
jgi:hypothetical protein